MISQGAVKIAEETREIDGSRLSAIDIEESAAKWPANVSPRPTEEYLSPQAQTALSLLLKASDYASILQRDSWQFAVEIAEVRRSGCTYTECRWLVCKGWVRHALEISPGETGLRRFKPREGLGFSKHTCFTLTETGSAVARSVVKRLERDAYETGPATESLFLQESKNRGQVAPRSSPIWDADRQELRVGGLVVKQFKVPAVNQERVLAAFEEEEWPVRIDDPLPPRPDQVPKRRLHDTINSLNRNQKNPLIRFLGDGRGEGVRWDFVPRREDSTAESLRATQAPTSGPRQDLTSSSRERHDTSP